jgi:site-specific DNA-methyltransferase (cytosine-N4-specific)
MIKTVKRTPQKTRYSEQAPAFSVLKDGGCAAILASPRANGIADSSSTGKRLSDTGNKSTLELLEDFIQAGSHGSGYLVFQGDAYDLIDALPDKSVDLFITSPPYWGLRTYGLPHNWEIDKSWKALGKSVEECPPYHWYRQHGGILGLESTPEWYVHHLAEILNKLWRPLKPSGSFWLNVGDTYFARWSSIRPEGRQGLGSQDRFRRKTPMGGFRQEKNLLLIPSRVAIALQESRWILRNDLIWFKPNVPPRPDTDRLRLAHEHFFHFVKRPSEGRAKYFYDKSVTETGDVDVVTYNVRAGENGHSATFPVDLIRPRILSSSPPSGLVVDPFCGTGRVLTEALSQRRRAIGFDLCQEFVTASAIASQDARSKLIYAKLNQ